MSTANRARRRKDRLIRTGRWFPWKTASVSITLTVDELKSLSSHSAFLSLVENDYATMEENAKRFVDLALYVR